MRRPPFAILDSPIHTILFVQCKKYDRMWTMKLSPTSYLVLGLVAAGGPCTPYDLKRLVAETVGYFWTFPHSQLYAEPARLAAAGLLSERRERGGRNRRHYTITEAGRAAVRAWLAEP